MTLTCKNSTIKVTGKNCVERATNRAITKSDVQNAIGTLGGTDFVLSDISIELQDNVFYPVSCIKEMRKAAIIKLCDKLKSSTQKNDTPIGISPEVEINFFKPNKKSIFVTVQNAETLKKIKFHYDYIVYSPNDYSNLAIIERELEKMCNKVFLNMPIIIRGDDAEILSSLKKLPFMGYVANNVSHFEMFDDKPVIGGYGLNHINSYFKGTFIDSLESDTNEHGIKYAYGKPPYMHFAHCPKKTTGGDCKNCNSYIIKIKDDKGKVMELRRIKEKYCYGILIPQIPINNINMFVLDNVLLDFSFATDEEIEAVNNQILGGNKYVLPCTHANINGTLY